MKRNSSNSGKIENDSSTKTGTTFWKCRDYREFYDCCFKNHAWKNRLRNECGIKFERSQKTLKLSFYWKSSWDTQYSKIRGKNK